MADFPAIPRTCTSCVREEVACRWFPPCVPGTYLVTESVHSVQGPGRVVARSAANSRHLVPRRFALRHWNVRDPGMDPRTTAPESYSSVHFLTPSGVRIVGVRFESILGDLLWRGDLVFRSVDPGSTAHCPGSQATGPIPKLEIKKNVDLSRYRDTVNVGHEVLCPGIREIVKRSY